MVSCPVRRHRLGLLLTNFIVARLVCVTIDQHTRCVRGFVFIYLSIYLFIHDNQESFYSLLFAVFVCSMNSVELLVCFRGLLELRALPLCCIHCLTTKMNVEGIKTPVGDCSGSERLHALQKLTMD